MQDLKHDTLQWLFFKLFYDKPAFEHLKFYNYRYINTESIILYHEMLFYILSLS